MDKTICEIQKSYIVAQARLNALKAFAAEVEREYIANNGILNPDNSVPEHIFYIEDITTYEKAVAEWNDLIVAAGLDVQLTAARAELAAAEDKMIEWGLSLLPAETRAALEKEIQHNAAIREKVIDLVFRLDASTTPT